ncbi:MAG: hypothetical protein PF795_00635 [Kiritimatiellae bacterium]|jgi:hypothetical protein|nr:hypothetical protein [Kiritimatiellia bacterium]
MKITTTYLTPVIAGLMFLFAGTATYADGPVGNHIQAAYADWDDFDSGFNLGVSYLLQPEIRLFLNYTDTDLEHMRIGAGKIFQLENNLSLELGASYQNVDAGWADDDGIGLHAILRAEVSSELTLAGKLEYVLLDDIDNETIVGIDADYRFTNELSGFVSYDLFNELDNNLVKLGARLHF